MKRNKNNNKNSLKKIYNIHCIYIYIIKIFLILKVTHRKLYNVLLIQKTFYKKMKHVFYPQLSKEQLR